LVIQIIIWLCSFAIKP